MNGLLVTFGCSWTYGTGAAYRPGISQKEYHSICHQEDLNIDYCYRTFLAKKYNLENLNFAFGGSSNQTQFRLAQEFFISNEFQEYRKKYKNIIIAWSITSTARFDLYYSDKKRFVPVLLKKSAKPKLNKLAAIIAADFYNHDAEVGRLYTQMTHWNQYFKFLGVKNIWFDTFNHHNYSAKIENLCFGEQSPRDLLSQMVSYKHTGDYHMSIGQDDSKRISIGVEVGVLNPYTYHPVEKGHRKIAEMLSPFIEERLS